MTILRLTMGSAAAALILFCLGCKTQNPQQSWEDSVRQRSRKAFSKFQTEFDNYKLPISYGGVTVDGRKDDLAWFCTLPQGTVLVFLSMDHLSAVDSEAVYTVNSFVGEICQMRRSDFRFDEKQVWFLDYAKFAFGESRKDKDPALRDLEAEIRLKGGEFSRDLEFKTLDGKTVAVKDPWRSSRKPLSDIDEFYGYEPRNIEVYPKEWWGWAAERDTNLNSKRVPPPRAK